MLSRRAFLGGVVTAAVGIPLAVAAVETSAFGATRDSADDRAADRAAAAGALALTVVNQTGTYANGSVWFYIVGTDLTTGKQAFVAPDGSLQAVALSDNGSDGFADLSIPLAGGGNTNLSIPANMSGRVYFSMNDKLKFKVVTDGAGNAALQYPAGWVSSDPSYNVLHDWIEFTHNDSGMFCNTTMVDQFSVPLAINLVGSANQTTGTLNSGGRDAIFNAIKANGDYSRLVIGDNLRIIAPGHGIDAGLFSSTYYDDYVNSVWSTYTGSPLTVTTSTGTFTGQVSGDTLQFSGGVAPFSKPTTQDIFYCNGALAAPNDGVTGPVAAVLGAGFNRSTLLTNASQPTTDPSSFYQGSPTNVFSQAMHANSADGKAYGFPFDDVASFAAYVQDTAPSSITLTLTAF
jgi:hypothetical protein